MKMAILAAAAALATAVPAVSYAQVAFNVGAVTDYRYRGISQSRLKPALQGGIDYAFGGGFYVGTWASSIKWIDDAGGDAGVEVDFYGGFKGEVVKDVTFDVGVLRYQYPGHDLAIAPNTTEGYVALTYGPLTAKYSHAFTNLFGFDDSENSQYFDLSASFEITDGWMIAPHVGKQTIKNNGTFAYVDWSLTLSKDFNGLVVSLSYVDTDTDKDLYTGEGKDLGKAGAVLGVKYNF